MRGNQEVLDQREVAYGSIPAYAGEPGLPFGLGGSRGVYPRVCGGTLRRWPEEFAKLGLSPRMRGNPLPGDDTMETERSIPAYAGEPRSRTSGRV